MDFKKLLPLTLFAAILTGCASQTPAGSTPVESSKSPSATSVPDAKGETPPATKQAGDADSKAASADPSSVPSALKTDAYDYFGLANAKVVDMEIHTDGKPDVGTGSVQTQFTGMKDGVAMFKTTRTGAIDQFGATDVVSCGPDGVYTVSTSSGTLKAKHLELPAKLAKGQKWDETTNLVAVSGQKIVEKDTYTVVGIERIHTKRGDFDALRIDSKGTAKIDKQQASTQTRTWYVKGLGPVKCEVSTDLGNGNKQKITLEVSKPS